MTIDDGTRQQISDTIKAYLYQFESHAKAIAELQKLCESMDTGLESLPRDMHDLKQRQISISEQILEKTATFKDLINQEKQNVRKIEKTYEHINDLRVKLLEVDEKMKSLSRTFDSVKACEETAPEVKGALSTQFKLVLDKLADARRNFPEIYAAVERETGIHFFTPLG